jgi:hypothetical protein
MLRQGPIVLKETIVLNLAIVQYLFENCGLKQCPIVGYDGRAVGYATGSRGDFRTREESAVVVPISM